MMAISDTGQVQGSVSGGCIEQDLIERVLNGGFEDPAPFVLRYGVTKDEAFRFGLPCGGTMELVIEPAPDLAALQEVSGRISGTPPEIAIAVLAELTAVRNRAWSKEGLLAADPVQAGCGIA